MEYFFNGGQLTKYKVQYYMTALLECIHLRTEVVVYF